METEKYPENLYRKLMTTILAEQGLEEHSIPVDMENTMEYVIDTLSPLERKIIFKKYRDGEKYAKIAAELDITQEKAINTWKETRSKLISPLYADILRDGVQETHKQDPSLLVKFLEETLKKSVAWRDYPENLYVEVFGALPAIDNLDECMELALQTILSRERKAIYGRYRDKKKLKEIGESLGVGMEQARQYLSYGTRKLKHPARRKYFQEYSYEKEEACRQNEQDLRQKMKIIGVSPVEKQCTSHEYPAYNCYLCIFSNNLPKESYCSRGSEKRRFKAGEQNGTPPKWCRMRKDSVEATVYSFKSRNEEYMFHMMRTSLYDPIEPNRKQYVASEPMPVPVSLRVFFQAPQDIPEAPTPLWGVIVLDNGLEKLAFFKTENGYRYIPNF